MNDYMTGEESYSSGTVPIALHDGEWYVIGFVRDSYYRGSGKPLEFTVPLGRATQGEHECHTAVRETMHEMLLVFAEDGIYKAFSPIPGCHPSGEVPEKILNEIAGKLGKMEYTDLFLADLGTVSFEYVDRETDKYNYAHVVALPLSLENYMVFDAEMNDGRLLGRQAIAVPVSAINSSNQDKPLSDIGALGFDQSSMEWKPVSEIPAGRNYPKYSKIGDIPFSYSEIIGPAAELVQRMK